jgi:carbon starvation protein
MLIEGFVGLLALVAACTLNSDHYFAINVKDMALSPQVAGSMAKIAHQVGEETLVGRTGGSVTLAVGMAQIFRNLPGMKSLMSYWYHFVIMFEALFILTTVDTGTRVARFIVQEMLGRVYKPLGKGTWLPGVLFTSFLVTYAWYYLLKGGTVNTIWPMFGIANQLLGVIALAVGTTYILRHSAKRIYALTTFVPFSFMAITVLTAGVQFTLKVTSGPMADPVKATLTIIMMTLAVIISADCAVKWFQILRCPHCPDLETEPESDLMGLADGVDIAD